MARLLFLGALFCFQRRLYKGYKMRRPFFAFLMEDAYSVDIN